MRLNQLLCLSFTAAASAAPHIARDGLSCREINIPVDVSANNRDLPETLDLSSLLSLSVLNDLVAGLGSTLVSGNYSIAARYCEPSAKVESRNKTLQILVHGIQYDRDYWFGLAAPGTKAGQDEYSWAVYAANEGYATLSIDRLCTGNSSRPLSLTQCQAPLEAETLHAIIEAARSGTLPDVQQSFDKIVYTGHSYGSLIGNALALQHPEDVDTYVFTGFSLDALQGATGFALLPGFLPAAVVAPERFGSDDLGYLLATNEEGAKKVFYYGDYDEDIFSEDFAGRQAVPLSEIATVPLGQLPAPEYQGSVFVLNGNQDAIFCVGLLDTLLGVPGDCSNGYAERVKDGYPKAKAFGSHITANTGHAMNNHRTAQESFKAAHDWLEQQGF
ncbi:hypothetical protein CKM354_001233300 [Cercospora kikuchii]|uniref:AB hydrolase-1 domain-containing protein n=1 Tax=Cercospora kikuchii TaxID=84275 RepID=A0A9P3L100_9PEZI|nr:uncharacterized protein CKM354_001233300 [Cercospora kikuchii]GIZ49301.1 hypothetical protein CKM354_001233300 [Cercospora kikuchii]